MLEFYTLIYVSTELTYQPMQRIFFDRNGRLRVAASERWLT